MQEEIAALQAHLTESNAPSSCYLEGMMRTSGAPVLAFVFSSNQDALNWTSLVVEHSNPVLQDWEVFLHEYCTMLMIPHRAQTVETALRNLCQGQGSVATAYAFLLLQMSTVMRWPSSSDSDLGCRKR